MLGEGGADSRLKSTNLSLDQLLNELFILAGGFPELVGELETYRSSKVVTFRKKKKTDRSTQLPSPLRIPPRFSCLAGWFIDQGQN